MAALYQTPHTSFYSLGESPTLARQKADCQTVKLEASRSPEPLTVLLGTVDRVQLGGRFSLSRRSLGVGGEPQIG